MAFSLANLCYARVCSELLGWTPADAFFFEQPPQPQQYVALLLNLLVAAGAFYALLRLARRHTWAVAALVVLGLLPLNGARAMAAAGFPVLRGGALHFLSVRAAALTVLAAAAVALLTAWRLRTRLARAATILLLAMSPIALLDLAGLSWRGLHLAESNPPAVAPRSSTPAGAAEPRSSTPAGAAEPRSSTPAGAAAPRRVVWAVFDEMDYRLAFVDRLANLALPELDRLRQQGLFATAARSAAPDTMPSVPAMLSGRSIAGVRIPGPSELEVRFNPAQLETRWSADDTVFSDVASFGLRSGVAGWYFPYCRVLNGALARCHWWEFETQATAGRRHMPGAMLDQARSLVETSLLSPFGQSLTVEKRARCYPEFHQAALATLRDASLAFVFLHVPAPHPPYPYDRRSGTFTLRNSVIRGYIDSLALVDRSVGDYRQALESGGLWDRTTLILTADHPFRTANALDGKMDPRVPLLIHLAGSDQPVEYGRPVSTLALRGLVDKLLRGAVATPAELAAYLDSAPPPGN